MPTVCAVPDPHIERWLLIDSAAFKTVFGRGARPRQEMRTVALQEAAHRGHQGDGLTPSFGGIEFADEIVAAMDLSRAAAADESLGKLIEELREVFQTWQR